MSPAERLREIEERMKAATPGPWAHGLEATLSMIAACGSTDDMRSHYVDNASHEPLRMNGAEVDAQFIAHSRADVEWLLSRVRELEADGRRLDWLDERATSVAGYVGMATIRTWGITAAAGFSLRAALDAAMSATSTPEGQQPGGAS